MPCPGHPRSMIGGIPETQKTLDFCAEHGIVADIEMIRAGSLSRYSFRDWNGGFRLLVEIRPAGS